MKAALEIFKLSTILVVAVFALLVMTSTWVLPGKIRLLAVMSGSMEPVIHTGSIVITAPIDTYKTHAIVTYARGGDLKNLVTHRISAVRYEGVEKTYLTKGDANDSLDPWEVRERDIVGRVVLTIPFLGSVISWVKTPVGFIGAVVLPAAILIYHEILQLKTAVLEWIARRKTLAVLILGLMSGFWMIPGSSAFLQDWETSTSNHIGIATDFSVISPTVPATGTPTLTPAPTLAPTLTPTPISPFINEFLADGVIPTTENDEWIEIYNPNLSTFDISGWKLDDIAGGSTPYVIPSGTFISAQGFLFFTKTVTGINLNNGSDTVRLLDTSDVLIDSRSYTSTVESVTEGRTTDGDLPWKNCTVSTQGSSNNGSC